MSRLSRLLCRSHERASASPRVRVWVCLRCPRSHCLQRKAKRASATMRLRNQRMLILTLTDETTKTSGSGTVLFNFRGFFQPLVRSDGEHGNDRGEQSGMMTIGTTRTSSRTKEHTQKPGIYRGPPSIRRPALHPKSYLLRNDFP